VRERGTGRDNYVNATDREIYNVARRNYDERSREVKRGLEHLGTERQWRA